jgi:hypothetical protein
MKVFYIISGLPSEHFAFNIVQGMIENDTEKRSKLPDLVEKLSTIALVNALKGRF